jgi:hypothetical protein
MLQQVKIDPWYYLPSSNNKPGFFFLFHLQKDWQALSSGHGILVGVKQTHCYNILQDC